MRLPSRSRSLVIRHWCGAYGAFDVSLKRRLRPVGRVDPVTRGRGRVDELLEARLIDVVLGAVLEPGERGVGDRHQVRSAAAEIGGEDVAIEVRLDHRQRQGPADRDAAAQRAAGRVVQAE